MDLVTHGVLGAAWAQTCVKRVELAALAALTSLTPDLDLLIRSSSDPLLVMEAHRQFTHSLLVAPVVAIACALLAYPWMRGRLSARATYLACLTGLLSHALLDACTSYGTELLWPLSDARVALSIIAVFDPALTLPLAVLVGLCLWRGRRAYAFAATAWVFAYLALGAAQQTRAVAVAASSARERGHTPGRLEAMPALGSLLLWKTIYEHRGRYYVDGVRAGLRATVLPGEAIDKLDVAAHFPWLVPGTQQARDIERFSRVADGFVAVDETAPNRVVDLRYSMVPNEISGFWAIVLKPEAGPDEHVELIATREDTPQEARRLLELLFATSE